jgi:hypothetical protein
MSYTHHKSPLPPEIKMYADAVRSRKRSASSAVREAGKPEKLRSYWDGGSRDEYSAFRGGRPLSIPVSGAPGFTPDPAEWIPQAGDVLVIHGTFCGKPSTPHIIFYK